LLIVCRLDHVRAHARQHRSNFKGRRSNVLQQRRREGAVPAHPVEGDGVRAGRKRDQRADAGVELCEAIPVEKPDFSTGARFSVNRRFLSKVGSEEANRLSE
jgi:hypothetical protein